MPTITARALVSRTGAPVQALKSAVHSVTPTIAGARFERISNHLCTRTHGLSPERLMSAMGGRRTYANGRQGTAVRARLNSALRSTRPLRHWRGESAHQ